MNRPFVLTGVALSAAIVLTGCGGAKKAGTVAESASAKARHRTPAATRAPAATATAAGTVRVGAFCKATGTVGKTSGGTWARCLKRPGDTRARWYSQAPSRTGVRAGEYCSRTGAKATSSSGAKLTCTKKAGETRARWRTK